MRSNSAYIKWRGGRHRFVLACVVAKTGVFGVAIGRSVYVFYSPHCFKPAVSYDE